MKLHFLLAACLLLATCLDSPVDSKSIDLAESDGAGLQKHSDLGRLIGGTPVDKASKFGSDEHHGAAKNATQSDSTAQAVPATNQYGASNGANVYGAQNTYGAGATYGSNQPLYGNQNGANFAPNGYLYNGGAYGANPCGCNVAQGGGYPQSYSVQGPKLQRNQDAIGGGQGNRYNQGYNVSPPYARYPTFNGQYSQPPVYPAPVMGYGYPQYNPYYPYTYPYGYYGYPPHGQHHYHHHKLSQQKQRSARHDKKHRVKKQRNDRNRDREENNWRKQE